MSKETRLLDAIYDAKSHGARIDTSLYAHWLLDDVNHSPSTNHWILAVCAELLNYANGHPTVWGVRRRILSAWQGFLDGPFMAKEQHTRNVYLRWIGEPVLFASEAFAQIAAPALAAQAKRWVRAYCGYLVLSGWGAPPPGISNREHEIWGPACITADQPPVDRRSKFVSVLAGKRSTAKRSDNRWRHWDVSTANEILGEIMLTRKWLSQDDRAWAERALLNDSDALLEVLRWTDEFQPKNPYRIIRTDQGMGWFLLFSGGGSTAPLYGSTYNAVSKVQKYLIADPGGRDSGAHDDDVGTGRCRIDGWVAIAQRVDQSRPPAHMSLPSGKVVLDVEWDGNKRTIYTPVVLPVDPPPPPPPPPPVDPPKRERKSWWERFTDWLDSII